MTDLTTAEAQLNDLVERRAAADRDRTSLDAVLDRAAARRAAALRREAEAEWRRFHENMAQLHRTLAGEHEQKARRLAG